MDAWGELTQISALRIPRGPRASKGATALRFDNSHDLLWVGDSQGYLYSYYSLKLQPYTSFRAHQSAIVSVLAHKKGVLSLSETDLRLGTVTGSLIYKVPISATGGLRAMSYTSNTQTEVWVAGAVGKVYVVDLVNGAVIDSFEYPWEVLLMDTNLQYVVLGRSNGSVDIVDPKPKRIVTTTPCHSASLSSIAVQGGTMLTTGYSLKKDQFVADPLVSIYNLQSLMMRSPLAYPDASFVFLHPRLNDVALIASNTGRFHFADLNNPSNLQLYDAPQLANYITSMDMAPSGDCFAFIDGMRTLHLWARMPQGMAQLPSFVMYATPVEVPSHNVEDSHPPPECRPDFDSYTPPLNGVKLPHFEEILLSGWPPELVFVVGEVPKPIDQEILRGEETIQGFQVAHYNSSRFGPRNTVSRYEKSAKLGQPRFISEQEEDQVETPTDETVGTSDYTGQIPNAFRPVRIAYSKFGVDDFDFGFYNMTCYSGLESDNGNTYTNSVLQLYRFCPPLCDYILQTLSKDVTDQDSLLVELGYLYDMLLKAEGNHCAASNFQRVFSAIREAKMLGLVTEDGKKFDDYGQRRLVQTFNRFLLERMAQDEKVLYGSKTSSKMDQICGVPTETAVLSSFCKLSQKRTTVFHSIDVNSLPSPQKAPVTLTICDYLEASLHKKASHQVNCDICKRQHAIDASLKVSGLPPVVVLNIDLSNEQLNEVRFLDGWLVPSFNMGISRQGTPVIKTSIVPGSMDTTKYEMVGYVAQVTDRVGRSHLVTVAKGPQEINRKVQKKETRGGGWYLYNDFLVAEMTEEDVFDMTPWWKKPVIVVYQAISTVKAIDCESWRPFDDSILYKDHFAKGTREGKIVEYRLLTRQEAPRPGTLIAIDAEFVQIEPPEFEISFHKQKRLVKPKKLALGRISALLGEGPKEGECFIDDYIVATETIDDYITSFSGIEPGDLDPNKSKRTVVTLQTAFRKMWLLLNLGVIFVGHSLKGDFRMINIHVPPEQVHDTAELFYLKKEKRKLSLKYLVYQLFHDNVQTGNHDSIEDADSALRCYRKYQELQANGSFESTLQRIYLEGQMSRFRIPSDGVQ